MTHPNEPAAEVVETDPGGTDRRTFLQRGVAFGLSGSALAATLAACGGSGGGDGTRAAASGDVASGRSAEGTPKRGGTLVYAWNFIPGAVLTPQGPASSNGDIWTQMQIYDQLTELLPGSLEVQPGAAESWERNTEGTEYTFALRDMEFSNGLKMTADDAKFSLDRFASPKINKNYSFLSAIESTKVLDPKHVRVRLKYAQGGFLDSIGHFTASMLPRRIVERLGEKKFAAKPVGSGAFVFDSREPGRSLTLTRNEHYWREGKPYLDAVKFQYVPDDNARILQVLSGDAHVGSPIPFSQIERVRKASGARLQIEPLGAVSYVDLNTKRDPFQEASVRLALNYAVPRDAIRSSVYRQAVDVANSQISKLRYWDKQIAKYPYDLQRAKAELKKSKVPNGFSASYMFIGGDADSRQVATILQDAWKQIGVTLELQQVDIATFYEKRNKNDFEMLAGPSDEFTSDIAADDELAIILFNPESVGFGGYTYSDPTGKRILESATQSADEKQRKAQFAALQRYGMETSPPWVPIAFVNQRTAVKKAVQGLETLVTGFWRLEGVWLNG